jgi:hypothetical protein
MWTEFLQLVELEPGVSFLFSVTAARNMDDETAEEDCLVFQQDQEDPVSKDSAIG